jgi:predicted HTH transcriptional regulator
MITCCLALVILTVIFASNLTFAGLVVPRLISQTDAISIVGVLATVATFLVSLKVTSVGHTIMRTLLVRETTRQVLLSVGSDSTFDEIQRNLQITSAQLVRELQELVALGLVRKRSESVAGKRLVEKYSRNF